MPRPRSARPNILLVEAHPDPDSYCRALAAAFLDGAARALRPVACLDLGTLPPFPALDADTLRRKTSLDPLVLAAEQDLKAARHLVLAFPLWWGTMPSVLWAWVQQVFGSETAWTVDDAGTGEARTRGLLGGLTVHLIVTADRGLHGGSHPLISTWQDEICTFAGCHLGTVLWCGPLRDSSRRTRELWLDQARGLIASFSD